VGPVLPALALPTHSADVCRRRTPSDRNSPLRIHGIHSFANFTLATANHLGRKGAFELRSLIRKRNQTNQLQTKLPTSGPGGRRFKSSLPDQSFSRSLNRLHCLDCFGFFGRFRYIRYNCCARARLFRNLFSRLRNRFSNGHRN